jgi:hypothetical protein
MEVSILSTEKIDDILKRLENIEKTLLLKNSKSSLTDEIINNSQLLKLLNISSKTAYNLRMQGKIAYSIVANKIIYKISDVEKYIQNNHRPAFENLTFKNNFR